MKKIPFLLLVLLPCKKIFSQLSEHEKKLVAYINAHMGEAEQLLADAVNINSGTLNKEGVKKTGAVFNKALSQIGFNTEWINLPDSLNRAGHLVATRKGKKGKKLFLIGHLDTVFEPDMPFAPYSKLNDSTATGQGVNDMKGGDVVIVMALRALEAAGLLNDASVVVYMTGDEENSGKPSGVSRADFIERAKSADVILGFEGAAGLRNVATARRGTSDWRLTVTAKTGHSSGVFSQGAGYGAIYEAARILNSFREQLAGEKYLTFNPGLIAGGSETSFDAQKAEARAIGKTNIISPAVTVTGDLRFLTATQRDAARVKMKTIAAASLPGTKSTLQFHDGIPAMEPTKGNDQLVKLIDSVSRDMGIGRTYAGDPGSRGAGDISYVAAYADAIDGLGASGRGSHAPGETINLKEFPILIHRAAILMYRLIHQ
ncbi:M20/M25/M40 family metallo-hydrolase [Sediminibacterium ginsengisoli]|uniref:Glutamate carboxypeptidase n=1 Tax=Sediminibacterium ginsengisoli TaxID=413434 RepID=A0A1T4QHL1_9BACT|nr:M20/M25/M40 family metallo-hydrolase [Sediminibacterium ginsengisoli]SKA03182.1 glutamate carboxypeptidase [Sediminibacterium ginsengisoli]